MDNCLSRTICCLLPLWLLLAAPAPLYGQQSFQVTGQGQTVSGLGSANFGVSADATADLQGYVVALGSDPTLITIQDLGISELVLRLRVQNWLSEKSSPMDLLWEWCSTRSLPLMVTSFRPEST